MNDYRPCLANLAVKGDCRNRGLGKLLVQACEEIVQKVSSNSSNCRTSSIRDCVSNSSSSNTTSSRSSSSNSSSSSTNSAVL